jgi:hypothetical protein
MTGEATNKAPWRRVRLAGMRKATGPETPPARRWRWDAEGVTSPAGTRYEAHLRRGLWLRRVQTLEQENAESSDRL